MSNPNNIRFYITHSLPVAQLHRVIHKRHIDYDDAHQTNVDCIAKFPLCPDSIWSAGFLIDTDATFHSQQNNLQNSQIKNQ